MAKIIGKDAIQAPSTDAIGLRLKGRSSDNASVLDFTNNAESSQQASITSNNGGLTLNLPDTADSYTFQVNGVTKAVVNNNGIDGQYLTTTQQPFSASLTVNRANAYFQIGGYRDIASTTFNLTKPCTALFVIGPGAKSSNADLPNDFYLFHNGASIQVKFIIRKQGGSTYFDGFFDNGVVLSRSVGTGSTWTTRWSPRLQTITLPETGTYEIVCQASAPGQDIFMALENIQLFLWSV